MIQVRDLNFEIFRNGQTLRLRVKGSMVGVETVVSVADLARLSGYLSPATEDMESKLSSTSNLDVKMADRIISAGVRSLARKSHPDKGGSTDTMSKINRVADELRSRIGG